MLVYLVRGQFVFS